MLNLISNALKFSFSGNEITITCKYISEVEDLTFGDEETFFDIVKSSKNGLLEVQVEDQGIGIIESDIKKLFRVFGFLENTQSINTSGIGLGLHLCLQIIESFDGQIICKS